MQAFLTTCFQGLWDSAPGGMDTARRGVLAWPSHAVRPLPPGPVCTSHGEGAVRVAWRCQDPKREWVRVRGLSDPGLRGLGMGPSRQGPSPGILHAHISCQAKSCLEAHTLSPYPRGCPGCQLLPSAGSEGHCWELRARLPSLGQQGHMGALSQ